VSQLVLGIVIGYLPTSFPEGINNSAAFRMSETDFKPVFQVNLSYHVTVDNKVQHNLHIAAHTLVSSVHALIKKPYSTDQSTYVY